MATIQTFYLHLTSSPPDGLTLPSGYVGGWDSTDATHAGATAGLLDGSAGSLQVSVSKSDWGAISIGGYVNYGFAQLLSVALADQSIGAANWAVGLAYSVPAAGATHKWTPQFGIYLINGTTGAIRTTIKARANATYMERTTAVEETAYSAAIAGGAFTVTAGDYLAFELGLQLSNPGAATTWTPGTNAYSDGTTTISSDRAATSSANAFIAAPVALTLLAAAPPPSRFGHQSLSGAGYDDPLE